MLSNLSFCARFRGYSSESQRFTVQERQTLQSAGRGDQREGDEESISQGKRDYLSARREPMECAPWDTRVQLKSGWVSEASPEEMTVAWMRGFA